jgi:uncharacterized membrane protein SpoIIM required for sporulation
MLGEKQDANIFRYLFSKYQKVRPIDHNRLIKQRIIMKHSTIALTLALASVALGLFSIWFFPYQGVTLAGLVLGTGFIVMASLSAYITHLLAKEGN